MKKFISVFLLCLISVSFLVPMTETKTMGSFAYNAPMDEYITYTRKEDSTYFFESELPEFTYDENNLACGPVAAAVALGYYNRWYPNLIPNYTPIITSINGKKIYSGQTQAVTNSIKDLITSMGAEKGVTVNKFKSGLTSYVNGKSRKISYNSTMSPFLIFWSQFDFEKYKTEIKAGRPVILCLDNFHIGDVGTSGKTDNQRYMTSKGNGHAMVGYGYRTIKYYRTESVTVWTPTLLNPFKTTTSTQEVNFRTDTFLMAETGQNDVTYLNISRMISIFDAFSVNIY